MIKVDLKDVGEFSTALSGPAGAADQGCAVLGAVPFGVLGSLKGVAGPGSSDADDVDELPRDRFDSPRGHGWAYSMMLPTTTMLFPLKVVALRMSPPYPTRNLTLMLHCLMHPIRRRSSPHVRRAS